MQKDQIALYEISNNKKKNKVKGPKGPWTHVLFIFYFKGKVAILPCFKK